jgi:hypothetical protein
VVPRARADRLRELLLRLDISCPLVLPLGRAVEAGALYALPVFAVMCEPVPAGGRPQVSQKPSSMVPPQPGY